VQLGVQTGKQKRHQNSEDRGAIRLCDDLVMQGVTDGHKLVLSHHNQRNITTYPKMQNRHVCLATHIGDDLHDFRYLQLSLGYSREKQMLAKERLERKKYIDVWK
jgi:hypothetical protein